MSSNEATISSASGGCLIAQFSTILTASSGGAIPKAKRKSVIITFKPKDQRPDKKKDKLDIITSEISSPVTFFAAEINATEAFVPLGFDLETLGFDINQYDAPIVTAALTAEEVAALKQNPNVAAIENDGPVYVQESSSSTTALNRTSMGLELLAGLAEADWYANPVNLVLRCPLSVMRFTWRRAILSRRSSSYPGHIAVLC